MERLLTPQAAAKIIAVSPRTIKEWLRKGELTGVKVRNMWRIRESDLTQLISKGTRPISFQRGRKDDLRSSKDERGGKVG